MKRKIVLFGFLALTTITTFAQTDPEKERILAALDKQKATYAEVAKKIWTYAEPVI